MKAQAKEQETLEYDCSVKYVEKQAPHGMFSYPNRFHFPVDKLSVCLF